MELQLWWLLLLMMIGIVDAHNGAETDYYAPEIPRNEFVVFTIHSGIGTLCLWVLSPFAIGMVAAKYPVAHKILLGLQSVLLLVGILCAKYGFIHSDGIHPALGNLLLFLWTLHLGYALVRQTISGGKQTLPILPHRWFGLFLMVLMTMTWTSGVLHVLDDVCGDDSNISSIPRCLFLFGNGFLLIMLGLIHIHLVFELIPNVEIALIGLLSFFFFVIIALYDLIMSSMFPVEFMKKNYQAEVSRLLFLGFVSLASLASTMLNFGRVKGSTLAFLILCHIINLLVSYDPHEESPAIGTIIFCTLLTLTLVLRIMQKSNITALLLIMSGIIYIAFDEEVNKGMVKEIFGSQAWYNTFTLLLSIIVFLLHKYISLKVNDSSESIFARLNVIDLYETVILACCGSRSILLFRPYQDQMYGEVAAVELTSTTENARPVNLSSVEEEEEEEDDPVR